MLHRDLGFRDNGNDGLLENVVTVKEGSLHTAHSTQQCEENLNDPDTGGLHYIIMSEFLYKK